MAYSDIDDSQLAVGQPLKSETLLQMVNNIRDNRDFLSNLQVSSAIGSNGTNSGISHASIGADVQRVPNVWYRNSRPTSALVLAKFYVPTSPGRSSLTDVSTIGDKMNMIVAKSTSVSTSSQGAVRNFFSANVVANNISYVPIPPMWYYRFSLTSQVGLIISFEFH